MPRPEEKELTMQKEEITKTQNDIINHFQYKKEDCEKGFLTDPDEIEEYVRHQQIDILQNGLLGDYDKDGEYYLPDEIRDELVKVPKVVTNNYENYIFAQSISPIGEFGHAKFFVMVSKLENELIATLTFVEAIHKMNKLVTNAQSVQIASFIGAGGEKFFYDMKKEFNIVDDDYVMPEDEEKDLFKFSLRRKLQRKKLWKQAIKGIERTEKEIFKKRMEILKGLKNEYSKEVLQNFNEQLKKKAPFFDKAPNEFTCLNQLLDECLGMASGKYPELELYAMELMHKAIKPFVIEQEQEIKNAKTQITFENDKRTRTKTIPPQVEQGGITRSEQPPAISLGDFKDLFGKKKKEKQNETKKPGLDYGANRTIGNIGTTMGDNGNQFGGFGGTSKDENVR